MLDIFVVFGPKIQFFLNGSLLGEKTQANMDLSHTTIDVRLGRAGAEQSFGVNADLGSLRILPYAPTTEQRRIITQYPNADFEEPITAVFSLPDITDSMVQFDARAGKYAGVDAVLFPDIGTAVPSIQPGRTLVVTDGAAGDVTISYREGYLS